MSNLLLKFFEYYAYFYDNNEIISITKKLGNPLDKKYEGVGFPIEDPFEFKHNPGNSLKINTEEYDKFIKCMKKEIIFILSGEYIKRFSKSFSK